MTYQRPGTFPSVDFAWDRLDDGEDPRCGYCRRRPAIGLLDDVPACLACVEIECEGETSEPVTLSEDLEREERRKALGW